MLAFITSLRHPSNSDDYFRIEDLLRETLRSIERQTSEDYVVIIVGNRTPSFLLPPRMHFVPVDFPPPARANGPHADRAGFVRDKGTKIGIGLIEARKFSPTSVMIFDADDFVHNRLVAYVNSNPSSPGWVVAEGWIYSRARNGYKKQGAFNTTCGTCYVLPYEAYEVPDELTVLASQDEVAEAFGERLPNIMGAHRNAIEWHRARGRQLRALPFRAAVYHVDTGENHSGKVLPGVLRPWTRRLEKSFAIPSRQSATATLVSCLSPTSVVHSASRLPAKIASRVQRRLPGRNK